MPPVKISCPKCKGPFRVPENARGRKVACPHCSVHLTLKSPSAMQTTPPTQSQFAGNTTSSTIPELPESFGRYRILKKIGQGAMGRVYLAQDTLLGRNVALKVPFFSHDETDEAIQRFFQEARFAATLNHPNICSVYDIGVEEGIHFLSMAYIEGETLADVLEKRGPFPERTAATLIRKLAGALQEAHDKNIIHRDLKPANIMVDLKQEPIIMDFGVARQLNQKGPRLTLIGMILGTPAYMSPEQVMGNAKDLGPLSDMFSLGIIFYELLTNRRPFEGSKNDVFIKVVKEEPLPPSTYCPNLDPQLEALVLKAMAKRKADRFASMGEWAQRLEAYLSKPPTKPQPTIPPAPGMQPQPEAPKPLRETPPALFPPTKLEASPLASNEERNQGDSFFGQKGFLSDLQVRFQHLVTTLPKQKFAVVVGGVVILGLLFALFLGFLVWNSGKKVEVVENSPPTQPKSDPTIPEIPQSNLTDPPKPNPEPVDPPKPNSEPVDPPKPNPKPVDPPIVTKLPYQPPSAKVVKVGAHVPLTEAPDTLLQKSPTNKNWNLVNQASPKVYSGVPTVALPGFQGWIQMETGPKLKLWGVIKEEPFPPSEYVRESLIEIHENQKVNLDLTLRRGRMEITNPTDNPVAVRLRFSDPTNPELHPYWDLILETKGTKVFVEKWALLSPLATFHPDPGDPARVGPNANLQLLVFSGQVTLWNDDLPTKLTAPQKDQPGKAVVLWESQEGKTQFLEIDPLPDQEENTQALLAKQPAAFQQQWEETRKSFFKARKTLAEMLKDTAANGNPQIALTAALNSKDPYVRTLGIRSLAALDNLGPVIDGLRNQDFPDVRFTASDTLRFWMGCERDNEYQLHRELEKVYMKGSARTVMNFLHSWKRSLAKPDDARDSLLLLTEYLNQDFLAIRQLAFEQLYFKIPNLKQREYMQYDKKSQLEALVKNYPTMKTIPYDPMAAAMERQMAQQAWRELINSGKLPFVPPNPNPEPVVPPIVTEAKDRQKRSAESLGIPVEFTIEELGMKFVWIPPGTFNMGSPPSEKGRNTNETLHRVTLTKGYYMAATEVTQKQWQTVMGNNPSYRKGDNNPVEKVSWHDCQDYIQKLNQLKGGKHRLPQVLQEKGFQFRLPTEAQWEYACRAGTSTPYYSGSDEEALKRVGWYNANSGNKTHPVAQLQPNAWGLYDMHGNVYEWCEDWYGDYPKGDIQDPKGGKNGKYRVLRGGSWYDDGPRNCRSALRDRSNPDFRSDFDGFRVVVSSPGLK